ncbi:MAG: prepilin peptidase [Patescibacteria group bacterium]
MVYLPPIPFAIIGLFVGSFLNLLIDRLYTGEQIVKGRSHCDLCKHELSWKDLIPLFSYLSLRGKCRYCHKPIGWQNAVVELVTAVVFGLLATTLPNLSELSHLSNLSLLGLAFGLTISCLLIVTFFSDLKFGVIYQELIIIGVIFTLVFFIANDALSILGVIGAVGAFGFFYILHKMFKGKAMGRGDADLAFLVALLSGFPNVLVTLFSSFLTGALAGVILILLGKKTLKAKIPFGPFLITGLIVGLLLGDKIVRWYIGLV